MCVRSVLSIGRRSRRVPVSSLPSAKVWSRCRRETPVHGKIDSLG
jgi:hypothetical protein